MTFIHKFQSGVFCRVVTTDTPPPNRRAGYVRLMEYSEKSPNSTLEEFQAWQNEVARILVEVWELDFLYRVDGWEHWGHDEPIVAIESSEYHDQERQDDWWKGQDGGR